jgi:hypothetical protein
MEIVKGMGIKVEISDSGLVQSTNTVDVFYVNVPQQNGILNVPTATTGTLTNEAFCTVVPGALVKLPSDPADGQKVVLVNISKATTAMGVSGSHAINLASQAVNLSGSLFKREFLFVSDTVGWFAGNDDADTGTSGSFTF